MKDCSSPSPNLPRRSVGGGTKFDCIVIGGGAAGFFAACRLKSLAPSLSVCILESAPVCLGKVKISGGGRCNVTHACFDPTTLVTYYPRGQRELRSVFARFGPTETMQWFTDRGVALKTETDGRIFPTTDQSQTIIDCLLEDAKKHGIRILTKQPVKQLQKTVSGFVIETADQAYEAKTVILACGSFRGATSWLQAMGHSVVSPVPSLFTFEIDDPRLTDLAGTSFESVEATLMVENEKSIRQHGPLLITHWGLSGPVILRCSAWGARILHAANYQAALKNRFFTHALRRRSLYLVVVHVFSESPQAAWQFKTR